MDRLTRISRRAYKGDSYFEAKSQMNTTINNSRLTNTNWYWWGVTIGGCVLWREM